MARRNIVKWTKQQRRAISARGSDVLVTASAGTGKTAVLSGRCVDIVSDESVSGDVLSMLVVTFTDAAAEEMRRRIAEQLEAAFVESGDRELRYQVMLLGGADISTIHSFCKRLITEHFYKLDLDPTFRVVDADEAVLLKAETIEKTIDWAWQQSNLRAGLGQLLRRRDLRTTEGFLARIIGLSEFLDGVVSRQGWYERARVLAEAVNPLAGELGEKQKQIVADKLRAIQNQLQYAKKLYESQSTGGDWGQSIFESHIKPVKECIEFLEAGDWERCAENIRNFKKPKTYKPKETGEPIGELIRKTVKRAIDKFEGLSELAILNPDYLDKVSGAVSLQTRVVIELVKKFDQLYSQAKRAINCLDFADLERYALELLVDENSSEDEPLPSETAMTLRRKYKYVFVDEYQDINAVQQAILDLLSSEDNIFVVGDVKQSIYAFRGAKSDVFLERLRTASVDVADAAGGLRVDLNANFRSAKGILDFVNKIFGRIMTSAFAKIDYDESAKLRPASVREFKDDGVSDGKPIVEFHILDEAGIEDKSGSEDSEPVSSATGKNSTAISNGVNVYSNRQRQAAMIAQRIREMVGVETGKPEFQVYDKQQGESRDVEYRDIVILMRSLAKKVNDYVEVLRLAGVPVSCGVGAGYFEATEISDMLCLLKVLDNPRRDIELAAVLRSPFFKISDTELAKIKIHGKLEAADFTDDTDLKLKDRQNKSFYDCVVDYCDCGSDVKLADKLKNALALLGQWRTAGLRGRLADLIWQVYRESGFLSFVLALPNGKGRRANLLKLHDRAIQFEGFVSNAGVASLGRFVEFIEKLEETGQDWSGAEPEADVGNAVRIMSVHKSKGLEFPVVFLAELDSQFNKRDARGDFLAETCETLGLQIIDRQSNTRLSSLGHQVIAERKLSTVLAEEMRILYVAMTRARERLVLSGCERSRHCRDIICDGFLFGGEAIADWQLRLSKSHLDWVLYGLCDQKDLHKGFETGLAERAGDDGLFSLKVYGQAELRQLSRYVHKLKTGKRKRADLAERGLQPKGAGSKLLAEVKQSLGWRYGFGDVVELPAKRSVTELTHRVDEYVRIDYSKALQRQPKAVLSGDLIGPAEGRQVGMAAHLVIARVDLDKPVTYEAVERTKERLLADGAITEVVAERIDTGSVMGFFESELGKAVLDGESRVWREWPFTFAVPASFVARDSSLVARMEDDETVIVQGIIDMVVGTPKGLLVIDFKTDEISAKQVPERAELYREQLELYGRAASAILRKPVAGKWLYFLRPGCVIEIKN